MIGLKPRYYWFFLTPQSLFREKQEKSIFLHKEKNIFFFIYHCRIPDDEVSFIIHKL